MNETDLRDLGGGTQSGLLASRARYAPDHVMLSFQGKEFTYREMDAMASTVAAGFVSLGLHPGSVVATFMTNRPEYLFTSYGINCAGLVGTSVNTAFKAGFLHHPLDFAEVAVLVAEKRLGEALRTGPAYPPALKATVFVDGVPEAVSAGIEAVGCDDFLARGRPDAAFPERGPDDTAAISFTSGTTGRSKGVINPNLQGVVMAREAAAFHLHAAVPRHGSGDDRAGRGPCGRHHHPCPRVQRDALVGRSPPKRGHPGKRARLDAPHAPCASAGRERPRPQGDAHFSAPAPADVLYKFERRFGVHLIEGYGSTEIKNVLYNPVAGRKIGSMGKPTPTSIVEIHDEHGYRVPPGHVGEVVYRQGAEHHDERLFP